MVPTRYTNELVNNGYKALAERFGVSVIEIVEFLADKDLVTAGTIREYKLVVKKIEKIEKKIKKNKKKVVPEVVPEVKDCIDKPELDVPKPVRVSDRKNKGIKNSCKCCNFSKIEIKKIVKLQRFISKRLLTTKILYNPLIRAWIKNESPFNTLVKDSRKGSRTSKIKTNNKEKLWGNRMLKRYFNYTKTTNQWTTCLGESLVKIILERKEKVTNPKTISGYRPDWETKNYIWEVKTRNYTTSGTAGEKILGTPYKYAEVPKLYKKNLKIVVLAFQEQEAIDKFGLFNKYNKKKNKHLELWKEEGIEFVRCSELL